MLARVLYHDHCFDGAASAAYFSRFVSDRLHPGAEFAYTGMAHTADQIFNDSLFDGNLNAIVDFKYSSNPRLDWWFDHHQSAFLTPADAEHYKNDTSGTKFLDTSFRSCTRFIATVAEERFGYKASDLADLVGWAEIVDGALYQSAEEAVALSAPAMKLVLVIEAAKGSGTVQKIIRMMQRTPLVEILADPEIDALFRPLHDHHLESIDLIRRLSVAKEGVVFFDLVGEDAEGYNKFIPYYLHPEVTYTVSVSESSFRTKVSVGSNPWAPNPLKHNLASICERYGGGGHPKVGAISFPLGAIEPARQAAREIVEELQR